KNELSLNYVAKDERISEALTKLQGFGNIILKGGTAINRVYLKNKRFSEDIDFDLVFKGSAKKAVPTTERMVGKLSGFEVAKPRIMRDVIRYDLYYTNPLRHKDRIMLEFKVVADAAHYTKIVVNFGFVPNESALLNVYDIEELIRHKIDCIVNRTEGKDYFDLYHLISLPHRHIAWDKEAVIKRLSLSKKEVKSVANTINHYIPRKDRPQWNMLLKELKDTLTEY
ncbi:MAG: nucleotidyl transferase AbiEii/AbiGii toxin family protein, partial [Candidatus Altiarchaeota archaeon]